MLNKDQRVSVAKETQDLTPDILRTTPSASPAYTYYDQLLPALKPATTPKATRVSVRDGDTFTVARSVLQSASSTPAPADEFPTTNPVGTRVAVLNLASERNPGGGWLRGALAQEEALCLRSSLGATLLRKHYPLATLGAMWSPGVAVFRGELAQDCRVYAEAERFVVGVVSVAGLRHPQVTWEKDDGPDYKYPRDVETMRSKIRQMMRVMAVNGITHCVLGALGCGVFGNPPKRVAQLFKEVIMEDEFRGHFAEVVFAILDPKREGNLGVFEEVVGDFVIPV